MFFPAMHITIIKSKKLPSLKLLNKELEKKSKQFKNIVKVEELITEFP